MSLWMHRFGDTTSRLQWLYWLQLSMEKSYALPYAAVVGQEGKMGFVLHALGKVASSLGLLKGAEEVKFRAYSSVSERESEAGGDDGDDDHDDVVNRLEPRRRPRAASVSVPDRGSRRSNRVHVASE